MMKILILDDKASVIKSFKKAVEPAGHKCTAFQDPVKGMKSFEKENFDLVITDLKMPHINGIEILQMVKKISPYTPVIIFSGFANVEDTVEALNNGASAFFLKPFEVGELVNAIGRIEKNNKKRLNREKYIDLIKEEVQRLKISSENIIKYTKKLDSE